MRENLLRWLILFGTEQVHGAGKVWNHFAVSEVIPLRDEGLIEVVYRDYDSHFMYYKITQIGLEFINER
jgi:hypothetical protein